MILVTIKGRWSLYQRAFTVKNSAHNSCTNLEVKLLNIGYATKMISLETPPQIPRKQIITRIN